MFTDLDDWENLDIDFDATDYSPDPIPCIYDDYNDNFCDDFDENPIDIGD